MCIWVSKKVSYVNVFFCFSMFLLVCFNINPMCECVPVCV